ncbi:uncharacterized protein LOC130965818 [Arachis stenosperma]|uniref:uncharacterized protein LOC130965818 n=1 Tax=Arachis stenosperma TaxID=217475 RepID=UPI0025AD7ED4|nr:uncharacterized protein LOC130965818 [Arachis stenosperma]
MTRFTDAIMEIPDLNPVVHLHALKAGLRPRKFREIIAATKPKTLDEFRERAAGQMEIEELQEADKTERRPRKENNRPSRSANTRDLVKPFKLVPKFDNYTRFNTKREKIIKKILNAKIIKPPTRAGSYQDQRFVDKSKHCAFHQKYGHTTDECVIAKDLLERLARQGLLDKYIEGRKHKNNNRDRDERRQTSESKEDNKWPHNTPPKAIINCISGGFAGGGETTSARKRSYRAMLAIEGTMPLNNKDDPDLQITFSQADISSAAPNLDDLVVISIQTVDCPSPYNVILERPTLNMFRAVVSTYHLCVKFQAQDGHIVTLHSDR